MIQSNTTVSGGDFLGQHYQSDFCIAAAAAGLLAPKSDWWRLVTIEGEPRTRAKRNDTQAVIADIRQHLRLSFSKKIEGNIALTCVFFRPNRQRVDTDNLIKFVLDAANGICWNDDSQITALAGFIEFEPVRPRTLLILGSHQSSMARSGIGTTEWACEVCGTRFRRYGPLARYCSHACMGLANETLAGEILCAWCQKPFRRTLTKQIFCSNECRLGRLVARRRSHSVPKPDCRVCGKRLSRHGYVLCRACWILRPSV